MKLPIEYTIDTPVIKGQKGSKVKLIQEWLSLNSISLAIDKKYGDATERAVKNFQNSNNLEETGQVDLTTFDYLILPIKRALTDIESHVSDYNQLIVKYSEQHYNEHPREIGNANCGPWVRLYMNGNEGAQWYWCAGFVIFILNQAANSLKITPPLKKTFSCDNIAFQAKKKGIFLSESDVRPELIHQGSLFIKRNSPGDWVHTGIVLKTFDDSFETIEGNTNDDGSRDGYEVCKRVRGYSNMDFVLI